MLETTIICYFEDDDNSASIVEFILEYILGCEIVYIRNNTDNPLEFLKQCNPRPTLILLDIHIKPNSGYQVLDMIRNDPELAGVKVIALTASFMKEDVGKMKKAGFDGGIAKPIDKHLFLGLLTSVINGDEVWSISSGNKS